jgi:hypothetical protein
VKHAVKSGVATALAVLATNLAYAL